MSFAKYYEDNIKYLDQIKASLGQRLMEFEAEKKSEVSHADINDLLIYLSRLKIKLESLMEAIKLDMDLVTDPGFDSLYKLREAEHKIEKLQAEIKSLKIESGDMKKKIKCLNDKEDAMLIEIKKLYNQLHLAEESEACKRRDELIDQILSMRRKYSELETKNKYNIDAYNILSRKSNERIKILENDMSKLQEKLDVSSTDNENLRKRNKKLELSNKKLGRKKKNLRQEIQKL